MSLHYRRFTKQSETSKTVEYAYIFGIENYQKPPTGIILIDKDKTVAKVTRLADFDTEQDITEYLAMKNLPKRNFPDSYTYATH